MTFVGPKTNDRSERHFSREVLSGLTERSLALTRNNVIGLLLGARPDRLWDWLGLGLGESHHKEQPRKGFVCAEWDITKSFN